MFENHLKRGVVVGKFDTWEGVGRRDEFEASQP